MKYLYFTIFTGVVALQGTLGGPLEGDKILGPTPRFDLVQEQSYNGAPIVGVRESEEESCADIWLTKRCKNQKRRGSCSKERIRNNCKKTCEACCADIWPVKRCENQKRRGSCSKDRIRNNCKKTCEACCGDIWPVKRCENQKRRGSCSKDRIRNNCKKTCE